MRFLNSTYPASFLVFLILSALRGIGAEEDVFSTSDKIENLPTSPTVTIEGAGGSLGTGFFVKWNDRYFIITNIHVLDGPRWASLGDAIDSDVRRYRVVARTLRGIEIPVTSFFAAQDRDVAMIPITGTPESYYLIDLDLKENFQRDRVVVALGNSQGGGTIVKTDGRAVALGPDLIETDTPVYRGNSGGPLLDVETGMVWGVVTHVTLTADLGDPIDRGTFEHRNSALKDEMRYFSHRLDNVSGWDRVEMRSFLEQRKMIERAWFTHFQVADAHDAGAIQRSSGIYRHDPSLERLVRDLRSKRSQTQSPAATARDYDTFISSLSARLNVTMRDFANTDLHWWFRKEQIDLPGLVTYNRWLLRELRVRRP